MDKKEIYKSVIAFVVAMVALNLWSYFFPTKVSQVAESIREEQKVSQPVKNSHVNLEYKKNDNQNPNLEQNTVLAKTIKIQNSKVQGSISTLGLKINNLVLLHHKASLNSSKNVSLLEEGKNKSYYVSLGFDSANKEDVPQGDAIWLADKDLLSANSSVIFRWVNKSGVEFLTKLSIDDSYMVKVEQKVSNNSDAKITFTPTYYIIKDICQTIDSNKDQNNIDAVGSINNVLKEYKYTDLFKENKANLNETNIQWIGDTEKYWMCALVPNQAVKHKLEFYPHHHEGQSKTMIIKCSDATPTTLESGNTLEFSSQIFCGAKEIKLLDKYKQDYNINLFDRGVDFGWLYFITKPLFYLLNYINQLFHNFGISIICLTFLIRLTLFPMLRKSESSLQGIKKLQPMVDDLNKRYASDKQTLRVKLLELYQREKINPVSFSVGCLPIVLQMPVWYGVYKVLQVVIELRHAPFILWVKDLSGPDAMYIFNLFGLIDISVPSFLQIGILPVLFGISLYFQQYNSPQVLDPVQQKVFKFLPIVLTFVLAKYPAGLLIYWTCNNILGILQQYLVKRFARK